MARGFLDDYSNNIMKVQICSATEVILGNVDKGDAFLVKDGSITKCTVAELPMYVGEDDKLLIYTSGGKYMSIVVLLDEGKAE